MIYQLRLLDLINRDNNENCIISNQIYYSLVNFALEQEKSGNHLVDEDTKKVIDIKWQRLRILEQQAAQFGINCPPHITLEIEQLRRDIRTLEDMSIGFS
jgi:hypothetical protein